MIMGLPLRCRYWSVLQVVVIVVCYREEVSGERAQGCIGSQLSLRCPEMKVIQITAVVLGDSNCLGTLCCIKDKDCTRNANENHTMDVRRRCDNKQSCTVRVLKEKIPCGYRGAWYNSDFERITYICIDDPQNHLTSTDGTLTSLNNNKEAHDTSDPGPTTDEANSDALPSTDGTPANLYNNTEADDESDPGPTTDEPKSRGWFWWSSAEEALPVVMVFMGFIILLAAVAFVVVMCRRKKRRQDTVKMSEIINGRKEAAHMNKALQETSLNESARSSFTIHNNDAYTEIEKSLNYDAKNFETLANDYCEIEAVAPRRIQCDNEYEQLDHGRYHEESIVYEQLQ